MWPTRRWTFPPQPSWSVGNILDILLSARKGWVMSQDKKYIELNAENFSEEVLRSGVPVLVDFWAEWCPPCRAIAPVIEALAVDFEGTVKVAKVDVDQHPELSAQYDISGIPALLFFKDGKVVERVTGVAPKSHLADKLRSLASSPVGANA